MNKKLFISDFSNSKKNNLDFLRFMAALLVIFSHAFPLSLGDNQKEPLMVLSNGQSTIGNISVIVFFVISGFLITQSYERTKSLYSFTLARILRIFPGLAFALLITTFIIGPIITTLPIKDYFTNISTYFYLTNFSLLDFSPSLPGVFDDNIYGSTVNGSLWTLKYEFFSYFAVVVLGVVGLLKKKFIPILFVLTFVLSYFPLTDSDIINWTPVLFRYFLSGMLFYLYREFIPLRTSFALISLVILLFSIKYGLLLEAFSIFGSYLVFYIAYSMNLKTYNFSKYGDFSYGMYIFAFPIQQVITQFNGNSMSPLMNFFISALLTLVLSFISWHLVEKRSLKLKTILVKKKHNDPNTLIKKIS